MRPGSWLATVSIGLINQVVASAINFALSLYLVRVLSLSDFGLWALAFSGLLLIAGLANGGLFTPMVVGYAARGARRQRVWAGSILIATILLALFVGLLGLGIGYGLSTSQLAGKTAAGIASGFGLAAMGVMLVHFFVRLAFCQQREHLALAMNLMVMLALILMLVVHHIQGWPVTVPRVLGVYAFAHGFALLVSPLIMDRLSGANRLLWRRHVQQAWQHGRWAIAGVWVSWAQSQVYVYLVPALTSLAVLGMINAARILAAPLIMLAPAINQIALPRISAMQLSHPDGVRHLAGRASLYLVIGALIYALIIAGFFEPIANILLGRADPQLYPIVLAWCAFAGITLLRQIATVWMQAARRFYELFVCEAMMLVVTVLLIGLLLSAIGYSGAVMATAIGEAMIALIVWRKLTEPAPISPTG